MVRLCLNITQSKHLLPRPTCLSAVLWSNKVAQTEGHLFWPYRLNTCTIGQISPEVQAHQDLPSKQQKGMWNSKTHSKNRKKEWLSSFVGRKPELALGRAWPSCLADNSRTTYGIFHLLNFSPQHTSKAIGYEWLKVVMGGHRVVTGSFRWLPAESQKAKTFWIARFLSQKLSG